MCDRYILCLFLGDGCILNLEFVLALYPEKILVKFGVGTKARIGLVSGNQQAFIRGAVEAALKGVRVADVAESGQALSSAPIASEELPADVSELLDVLGRPMTERAIGEMMEWTPGRVSKAIRDAGDRLCFPGGGMVARA